MNVTERLFFKAYTLIFVILCACLCIIWGFIAFKASSGSEKNNYEEVLLNEVSLLIPKEVTKRLNAYKAGVTNPENGKYYKETSDNLVCISNHSNYLVSVHKVTDVDVNNVVASVQGIGAEGLSYSNLSLVSSSDNRIVLSGKTFYHSTEYVGEIYILKSNAAQYLVFISGQQPITANSITIVIP